MDSKKRACANPWRKTFVNNNDVEEIIVYIKNMRNIFDKLRSDLTHDHAIIKQLEIARMDTSDSKSPNVTATRKFNSE